MSLAIFPSAADEFGPPPASDDTGPVGRWVLHRAGIVNVWQYDRTELRFAGGRLLLRGKNGAGKSKALEVLLPFLLDGDTRRLDATGRDRTTVRWLMSDGRPNGNHVGYVWLELRCADADGAEQFVTLGAGLKVASSTGRSDTWFFITDRRVGVDLALERGGECLSVERLKEAIGIDAVTTSGSEHRRRVGRHLYGLFDDDRYDNLLHLLHRLRDPNVGNRVEGGELANVLSDALPPLDERVLGDAAARFDDLDAIREQVERADRTAAALGEFLGIYRGYTRTVLGRRSGAVIDADDAASAAQRDADAAQRAVGKRAQDVERFERELRSLHAERSDLDSERSGIERSDAYRAHLDLADREGRVAALDDAAQSAETTARRSAEAHTAARDDAAAATQRRARAFGPVGESDTRARVLLVSAGLDAELLGAAAAADAGDEEISAGRERVNAAATAARVRTDRARELHKAAGEAARAAERAGEAEERAAESESTLDAEVRGHDDARRFHAEAAAGWTSSVDAWIGAEFVASLGADWTDVRSHLDRPEIESGWPPAVRAAVAQALRAPLDAARHDAAAADAAQHAAAERVADADQLIAGLEAEAESRPLRSRFSNAERDPAAGAPFYELVDLDPGLPPEVAAGFEAALEASGLLDAWVGADGLVIHPSTRDVIVAASAPLPEGVTTLASVLHPAVPESSPVSAAAVAAVLSAVAAAESADAPVWVDGTGRWRTGVLRGAWAKDAVEFIGAGARENTRQRRLAAARRERALRAAEHDAATTRARRAAEHRDRIDGLPSTLPGTAALDDATALVATAAKAVAAARARFDRERKAAEELRSTAQRLATGVADRARRDALPTEVAALGELVDTLAAAREAVADLGRHLDGFRDAAGEARTLAARVPERAAEAAHDAAAAEHRRREHRQADHELRALRDAIGAEVNEVLARLEEVGRRITAIEGELVPAADKALADARHAHAEAVFAHTTAVRAHEAANDHLAAMSIALQTAVDLAGVVQAATGAPFTSAATGLSLARVLLPLVDGDDPVSDGTVLSRYDRLSDALAGGYDTAIDESDGIKVVHIDDDAGRRPLAVVAELVAEDATAAHARLAAREREVLERFLLRELVDEVRSKLLDAHDLVSDTNRTLRSVRSSHGKGAHLDWVVREDAPEHARVAVRLLLDDLRDDEGDAALRDALLALIDDARTSDPTASYEHHLRLALDYRTWHRFTVRVTDGHEAGSRGRVLSSRLGLSQGEQRVICYMALFAAASAHFDAIARGCPTAPRLLLLDDAFAKVDEPTHGRLLGLLVELGLDFVVTSERLWGCFDTVPGLEIYEAIRDPEHPGVALMHFRWDGHRRTLVGV